MIPTILFINKNQASFIPSHKLLQFKQIFIWTLLVRLKEGGLIFNRCDLSMEFWTYVYCNEKVTGVKALFMFQFYY